MKVFISHAFTDTKLAKRVADSLKEAGMEVWDSTTSVLPGENWGDSLAQALRDSNAMVVLLTPDSVHSPNVSHEIGYALGNQEYQGRVVPVIAAPPEQLSAKEIPWILNRFQTVQLMDLEHDDEGLKKIAQLLSDTA